MPLQCPFVASLILSTSRRVCAVLLANRLFLVLPSSYLITLYLPLPRSVTATSVPGIPREVSVHRMADHFPSLPIPGLAPVGHVEMRVKQSKSCFTRHVLAAPPYLLTGGRSSTAVSSASASTGVLATTADLCSTFT